MSRRVNRNRPKREMCWDGGWEEYEQASPLGIDFVQVELPWWKNIF